ncbi:MAG: flagellar biosynthetic protein FliO [Gammaproteobacteria bacterium]|nr:flagellar biosynthetic protein FliO [Gammaproteobacteria bacterium]
MENQYIHMVANLIAVLAFILVLVYLLKKLKSSKYSTNQMIKIMNVVSVGTKEKVILMEVNNTILLVGATPNHIETLYVFDASEAEDKKAAINKNSYAEEVANLAN